MTTKAIVVPENMVLIPAGRFRMGADNGYAEEAPAHEVSIDAFLMDRQPVTNRQFKEFCDEAGRAYPASPRWERLPDSFRTCPDHPAVNVSYDDAAAYAAWSGKRLPSEAEWEYAARGGLDGALYPWGDDHPAGEHAQYAARESPFQWREWRHGTGHSYTAPAGSFPANGYGLHDMAGNAWEWCATWFYRYPDEEIDPAVQDGWGLTRILRGGAFYSPPFDLRVSRRLQIFGTTGGNGMGFRCVADVDRSAAVDQADPTTQVDEELIRLYRDREKLGTLTMKRGVELCLGFSQSLDPADAQMVKQGGFTSVEQYVTWETVENAGEGAWDFSRWDEQVKVIKRNDLKWVPFLIAGPAYSLPDWYRRSDEFRGLACLEHRIESAVQSIWDPRFELRIDRFMAAFAARYRDAGVLESLLLGITGDFGEAIFPVASTTWPTVIPGPYHTHSGYWCGDWLALADFRARALARYDDDLDALNSAWGTTFSSGAAISPPPLRVDPVEGFRVDEPTDAGTFDVTTSTARRRWLDFVDWYRESMNRYAETWLRITRKHFPDHPIYLCTGGHAPPHHGAHFGDQCRIAARYDAGVRITNEASDYTKNFALTQWVASAGRHHGAYYGFEPAGRVNAHGVTGRIYNAAVAGAKNLHFYGDNIAGSAGTVRAWSANFDNIMVGTPVVDVAVLYPDTPMMLGELTFDEFSSRVAKLRDALDVAFVDEGMIAGGTLANYSALIVIGGTHFRDDALSTVMAWICDGGRLAIAGPESLRTVDGDDVSSQLTSAAWFGDSATNQLIDWLRENGVAVIDGEVDEVYVAQLQDRVVVLHHGQEPRDKQLALPDGSVRTVHLAPNSILQVDIPPSPGTPA